ncbi:MAG: hypothetical protein Q8934_08920 [Bacillota bacterium]|nr:hypothetical protein [Bacillota bacterium]
MKLLLISEDEMLLKSFQALNHFDVAAQADLRNANEIKPEILIISDRQVHENKLIEMADDLNEIKYIFYMVSGLKKENEQIEVILKSKHIEIIQPRSSHQEIINHIVKTVTPQRKLSNIHFFFGSDRKVGTTITTQAIAELLAEHTDKKVLMLSLNDRPNDQYINVTDKSIDSLKSKLQSKLITISDILNESYCINNFYYLPGPRDILGVFKYTPEDITYLLDLLELQKDCITLIDGGSDLFNPLSVAAIQLVSNRYLITTSSPSAVDNFKRVENQLLRSPIFNLKNNDFLFILNKFDELNDALASDIASNYRITMIGFLPLVSESKSENERKTLNEMNQDYKEKLYLITKVIATKANITMKEAEFKKSSLLQKVFGR